MEISDHTPFLIDSGQPSSNNNAPLFKFELGWLQRDEFMEMVKDAWISVHDGGDMMRS
jgi:hypothetical protein